jgi:L-iditol 2-dehydrogenase
VANRGVVRIPDGVPFEQAAFVEPVNTVLKGVKLLNLAADDTVLVIGQGPIGLMHAALARRTGARVLTSDLYPERHAIAAKFGLTIRFMPARRMWSNGCLRRPMGAARMR